PDRLWAFREAVRGLGTTAKALGLAIPSGNVSFYNESPLGPCPPTPVVLGVGIVEDLRVCVTTDFKVSGDPVVLVGTTQAELGGSEYFRLQKKGQGPPPGVDPMALRAAVDHLLAAIGAGTVAACHDLSHGGLAVAAAEMALGGDLGADLKTTAMDPMRWDVQLFSESNGRWLVEVRKDRYGGFGHLMEGTPGAFVRSGKPVFCVCAGCQVLVEAGLLPALGATMTAAPEAVLATNDSGHYECRPSLLKLENGGSCAFTRGMKLGRVVTFISAHAEGKFLLPKDREKKMLKELV